MSDAFSRKVGSISHVISWMQRSAFLSISCAFFSAGRYVCASSFCSTEEHASKVLRPGPERTGRNPVVACDNGLRNSTYLNHACHFTTTNLPRSPVALATSTTPRLEAHFRRAKRRCLRHPLWNGSHPISNSPRSGACPHSRTWSPSRTTKND